MDKYSFTKIICNDPFDATLGFCSVKNFIIYKNVFGDEVIVIAGFLDVGHTYYYCPNAPALSQSRVSREYWAEIFRERDTGILEKVTIRGKEKTFNTNKGKIAFVLNGRVFIFDLRRISEHILEEERFILDRSLLVPLSNCEGYLDTGTNLCVIFPEIR